MNSFFEYYFYEYDFSKRETAVCCPFPHHTASGFEYNETNPSAHINLDKGLFHCKVCDKGLTETGFIAELFGCSYESAIKISKMFTTKEDIVTWDKLELTEEIKNLCLSLGISEEVIEDLKLKTEIGDEISFPVIMYNKVVDVRSYRPQDRANKIRSRSGTTSGMIIPFDLWVDTPKEKWTIICAGEKDMAVTRSQGFNAITLTGGEKALPKIINPFRDRRIAICYDNDEAGISGAKSLAAFLMPYAQEVRVVTSFHEVCTEHGEDLTDFFTKYKKNKKDLQKCILDTPAFTQEEARVEILKRKPLISLLEASKPQYINRVVQSNVQVVATFEKAMPVPTTIYAKKVNVSGDNPEYNRMLIGEEKTWELSENNCQDILKLIDNNFTETQIRENIREILGISKKERDIKIEKPTKETVYECNVTDLFESTSKDVVTIELTAYVLGKRLESGKKYLITYKLVPHPYKGQQLIMIILDVEEACDSISNFRITDEVKNNLNKFKELEGTVEEKLETLAEKVKGYIGYNGYNKLIQAIDLSFHTVLEFNFGTFKNIRGYLDTLVVAESRVGKSSTAETLQKLYGLGAFASLAGNSATIPGIVGGSQKVNGSFQTRAGLIPMNHRGLVIFEELAKSNSNLVKELTDIRSSNQVRIARVSGTLTLPALVRMITLTNVKNTTSKIKPINSYPNGLEILVDLIGSPEDIARYDLMLVLGDNGNRTTDPFWVPQEPFEPEAYQTRIRWVWSRDVDQVVISSDVGRYIIEKCNELNTEYESHIKIFGTEAWKKVSRLAIAIAGYLVSTDETYEKIIVNKEHVDAAVNYLISCYDNETFKLREYVTMEKMYNTIDDDGVALLQELYNQNPSIMLQLERLSKTNKQNLMAATGLDSEMYNRFMQRLTQGLFIQFEGYDITPTQRFRLGMSKINRAGNIHRIGEHDA